ncbi:hypothetical protein AAFF_G00114920 [Aldrovandia affinis]|uniref:Dystrotelin n=1 Tax=Aldrovandia affinis TaxID=143900 RepID=A0AAD7WAC6_9TELE|nr:hypothetical protein AAFF_G00114920 [Aldrovandia affinis]
MDLDVIEGLNEVVPAVYRAAFKLRSLQNLCQMHSVTLSAIGPALRSLGVAVGPGGGIAEADVGRSLEQLFQGVSEELPGQLQPGAAEHTCRLLFKVFDRKRTGSISLQSVEAALIALSGDTLSAKHTALFRLAERCSGRQGRESGTVSRSGLRTVLDDLSQVPAVVQESQVFGPVESAVRTCFQGVISAGVSEEVFLRWLRSEPRLLLWLSTLYRISASEAVIHRVRCHVCKAFPITGLRYRCLKCLNLHLCQTCFLTHKRSRRHKPSHPMMEHCTQPSFRESLTSLAHSARHNLLRRREAERRSALCKHTPAGTPHSATSQTTPRQTQATPPHPSLQYEATPPHPVSEYEATPPHPASEYEATPPHPASEYEATPTEPRLESKAMQTDTALQPQRKKDPSHTRMAVRDLRRDKWQLEKQLQVWRVAAQTEHSSLEDKCCHLEATVEVLTRHNQNLQDELGRVRLLLQPLCPSPLPGNPSTNASTSPTIDAESPAPERGELVGERPLQDEQGTAACAGESEEEELEAALTPGTGDQCHPVAPEPQCRGAPAHNPRREQQEQEHAGKGPLGQSESFLEQEEELGDLVLRLKSALSVYRRTGQGSAHSQELLAAAVTVGDSVAQLVCAAGSPGLSCQPRPNTPGQSANHAAALSQLR